MRTAHKTALACLLVVLLLCSCTTQGTREGGWADLARGRAASTAPALPQTVDEFGAASGPTKPPAPDSMPQSTADGGDPNAWLIPFSQSLYVPGGPYPLNQKLVVYELDESLLASQEYAFYPIENSLNGIVGHRLYQMDGYAVSCMEQFAWGNPDETYPGISSSILYSEEYVLENGVHTGMALDEAAQLLAEYGPPRAIAIQGTATPEYTDHGYTTADLCWGYFYPGLFEQYAQAHVYSHREPDEVGQLLVLYADGDSVICAITNALWGAG